MTYTLGSHTPEREALSVRPRGKGKSDAIAVDEDGSGTLGALKGGLTSAKLSLRADYNERIAGKPGFKSVGLVSGGNPESSNYIRDGYMGLTTNWLSTALARAGHKGYLPGLAIYQAVLMDTYNGLWGGIGKQEGKGVEGTVLLFGNESGDNYNKLALHEISHGFYLQHAPGGGSSEPQPKLHDKDDVCVLSYAEHDGDHCGQCVASLRGMAVRYPPFVAEE